MLVGFGGDAHAKLAHRRAGDWPDRHARQVLEVGLGEGLGKGADGRGRGEGHAVGAQQIVALGHGELGAIERADLDGGAGVGEAVGQQVARLLGAGDQHALTGHAVLQRFE